MKASYNLDDEGEAAAAVLAGAGARSEWFQALLVVLKQFENSAKDVVCVPHLAQHEGTFQRGRLAGIDDVRLMLMNIVATTGPLPEKPKPQPQNTGHTDRKGKIVNDGKESNQ